MGLFQLGDFPLASGGRSRFRIECDALTADDWQALAAMAAEVLRPFRGVAGVPAGGLPFAAALGRFATGDDAHPFLVAEDVCTTGGSMGRFLAHCVDVLPPSVFGRPGVAGAVGVCVFARGKCPGWVVPLFQMAGPVPAK